MNAPPVVTEMLAEAELSGDADLAALLTTLHALGDGPAPAPTPELTARLGIAPLSKRRRWLRGRVVGGATAFALAAVAATGAAAAANELPPGVQQAVARFSERFLPFDFPAPRASGPVPPRVGTGPVGRTHDRRVPAQRPAGPVGGASAAEGSRSGAPAGVTAARDGERAVSGGDLGTRSAADDGVRSDRAEGAARTASGGGSGDADGSRDGTGSGAGTSGSQDGGSEQAGDGTAGTGESSDGSGSTAESDGSGSGQTTAGSDHDYDSDSGTESGGSSTGGG